MDHIINFPLLYNPCIILDLKSRLKVKKILHVPFPKHHPAPNIFRPKLHIKLHIGFFKSHDMLKYIMIVNFTLIYRLSKPI